MREDAREAWLAEIELCTDPRQLEKIGNALGVYVINGKRPLAFSGPDEFVPPIRQRMRWLMFDIIGRPKEKHS